MANLAPRKIPSLQRYAVKPGGASVSGLSSGAFMTVQLHLAHSSSFIGAGVIAGGPYRCVESFRGAAPVAEDAYVLNAEYICMSPLIPKVGPNAEKLAALARQTADAGLIDPLSHLAGQRLYIFTGQNDAVLAPSVVRRTREFYLRLGVSPDDILFVDDQPAGHSIITDNPEDLPLDANRPPYINYGGYMQSHVILNHIYPGLAPAAAGLGGDLLPFDQTEFLGEDGPRASMGPLGFVYVPSGVKQGRPARGVHIVLHGCKQGYDYVEFINGRSAFLDQPPYGGRYMTTTGYNQMAESNDLIMLYPQARGDDDNNAQNPEGCWDWWGYTSPAADAPDYYSRNAVQIRALHAMLERLCGDAPPPAAAQLEEVTA
jgi:poly(3-hydroxybutyrate) depolymerase